MSPFLHWFDCFHRRHADAFWTGLLMFSIGVIVGSAL